jgi:hypothetical protein
MCPFGDIASASRLNRKHDAPNMGCQDGINGQVTDDREDISLKAIHQGLCVPWRLTNRPPCPPFAGHLLQASVSHTLYVFGLLLLCFGFCFAFGHRIGAGSK